MFQRSMSAMAKVISLLTAIIFIVIGTVFYLKFDPEAYDTKAFGTIVAIDEHYEMRGEDEESVYQVYIDYTAAGQEYRHVEFPEYNWKMQVGDTVEFYYRSEDPTQITGSDKDKAPYLGLVFAGVGVLMLIGSVVNFLRGR